MQAQLQEDLPPTVVEAEEKIRQRIVHILRVYPAVSPSMLQISMHQKAHEWKPILEHMIADDYVYRTVVMSDTPEGRLQNYTVLRLGKVAYNNQLDLTQ